MKTKRAVAVDFVSSHHADPAAPLSGRRRRPRRIGLTGWCALIAISALTSTAVVATAAARPRTVTVSPGALDGSLRILQACPTFSWAAHDDVRATDLVVIDLGLAGEQNRHGAAEMTGVLVLRTRSPRGAGTWTPPADQCLRPGRRYAWFVRSEGTATAAGPLERASPLDKVGDRAPDGSWSAGRLFEVALPDRDGLEEALATIQHHLGDPARATSAHSLSTLKALAGRTHTAIFESAIRAARVLDANAALSAAHTDQTGPAAGVAGLVASSHGSAIQAANVAGGDDLAIDGSADGQVDARITQAGLDRGASSNLTFGLSNTGSGAMTLRVNGQPIGTIDQITAGAGLEGGGGNVSGNVELHVRTLGVQTQKLATGSVTGDKVMDRSLTELDFAAGSLTTTQIRNGHIRGEHLVDGAVTADKLGNGAIYTSDLAILAATRNKLAEVRVVALDCKGECTDSSLTQTCTSIGPSYRAVAVDSNRSFSATAPVACGGDNECRSMSLDNSSLASLCKNGDNWDCRVYCMAK